MHRAGVTRRAADDSSEQRQLLWRTVLSLALSMEADARSPALSPNGIFLLRFKLHFHTPCNYQCISLVLGTLQCIALLCST